MHDACPYRRPAIFLNRFILLGLLIVARPPARPAHADTVDAPQKTPHQILILNSHDHGMSWQGIVNHAIAAAIDAQSSMDVSLHTEYTGLSQHDDDAYMQKRIELYEHKFSASTIDRIIAVDTRATNFMIDHGEELFPSLPIVSINDANNMAAMESQPNMTGLLSTINVEGTLDVIVQLHPGTRTIALISGTSKMDRSLEDQARDAIKNDEHRLAIIDLTGLRMEKLLTEVGRLPQNTVGLYLLTLVDGAGESFIPREILPRISQSANAPLYGLYDTLLGSGVVGGNLSSAAVEGKRTAETALRILAGEKPAQIPIVRGGHAVMFDWRQLQRWNIGERNLPMDSIVRYQSISFLEKYKGRIIGIGALVLVQGTRIVFLLVQLVGFSEILMEDLPSDRPEHDYATEILKAAKRGSDLVKQILAFSRQSEHKMMPVRVQQILKEALKLSRSTIPADIEITDAIQPDCGLVEADPVQLHQIAMNLITNAYHAMEGTKGKLAVVLREVRINPEDTDAEALPPGHYAMLSVTDTGCGIAADAIDKIFEPYFTTKAQGKGTGLGLAVVHGIVKEHKGEVEIHSEVGTGTAVNIYLPLMESGVETAPPQKAETPKVGQERILIVDDEEMVARLEKQILERLGYRVVLNTSSVDAMETFKTSHKQIDMVITDMTMPNMTGDQLASALLAIRPDIPIIVCTGFSERINREKAEAIGIRGFLMKPVVKSEMARMVRKVLDEAVGSHPRGQANGN